MTKRIRPIRRGSQMIYLDCDWDATINSSADLSLLLCKQSWCWRIHNWGRHDGVGIDDYPNYCQVFRGAGDPVLEDTFGIHTGRVGCGANEEFFGALGPFPDGFLTHSWEYLLYFASDADGQGTQSGAQLFIKAGDIAYLTDPYRNMAGEGVIYPDDYTIYEGILIEFFIENDFIDGDEYANFPVWGRTRFPFGSTVADIIGPHCGILMEPHLYSNYTIDNPPLDNDPEGEWAGWYEYCHNNDCTIDLY